MAFNPTLSWNLSSTPQGDIDGQRVYRSSVSNPSFPGDFTQVAEIGNSETSFADSVSQGTYTYAITAFNFGGESPPTTAGPVAVPPVRVDGEGVTSLLDNSDATILLDGEKL